MARNKSGFANIWLVSNQLMASCGSDFNVSSKLVISLVNIKVGKISVLYEKNKSFMNQLNSIGPNIEPCGTSETNILNRFSMLFVLNFSFLFLNRST